MTERWVGFSRASVISVLLFSAALLNGCASGPATRTEMLGDGTYLIFGSYGTDTKTEAALKQSMQKRSDMQCPGGWTELANGANPHAVMGGKVWKIRCTGDSRTAARPPADSGAAIADGAVQQLADSTVKARPTTASADRVTNYDTLLDRLSATAQQTVPGLTPVQAVAVARAQLKWLADKGIALVNAEGKTITLP